LCGKKPALSWPAFFPEDKKKTPDQSGIFDPAPNAEGTSMKTFCRLSGSNQRTLRRAISRLK